MLLLNKTFLALMLGVATVTCATSTCTPDDINYILTTPDVWNDGTPSGAPSGILNSIKAPTLASGTTYPGGRSDWKVYKAYLEAAFKSKECVKKLLNVKDAWTQGTFLAKHNLLLAIKPHLDAVELGSMTDLVCQYAFGLKYAQSEAYPFKSLEQFRMACYSSDAASNIKLHWTPKMVREIPANEFAEDGAKGLVKAKIQGGSDTVYSRLTKDQLSSYLSNNSHCSGITEPLATSIKTPEINKVYTAECLSQMDWFTGASGSSPTTSIARKEWVRSLDAKAFANMPKLNAMIVEALTGEQVAALDSENKNVDFRCADLPIEEVHMTVFGKLTKECIAGRVNNSSKLVEFGPLAAKLPADAFSGVFADEEIIGRVVHSKNTEFLTADHYKMLLALTPKAWSKLAIPATSAEFPWDRLPVVTGEALRNMGGAFRVAFLASYKAIRRLAEDALADFTATEVTFAAAAATSPPFVAKGALEMIAKVNHKVIHNLGRDVPSGSQHPCAGVKLADYKAHQSILDHAGFRCIRSLAGIDAALESEKPEEVAKLPAMVLASFEYDRLMKFKDVLPKNFFVGMTPSIFAVFASPANCAKFSKEVVGSLDPKVFTRMSLECFGVLNVDLTATQISTLTVELFARLTRELFAKLKIYTGLSVEQLGSLSTAVTDPTKHAAHALVKAIFAGFTAAQVGALNERTVALMPVDNWEALRTDMLKAMKPEVLVSVNAERMLKVPPETRYVLSATQAKMLGSKVPKEQHPRAAFPPEVLENMVDKEAAKVMGSAGTMVVASMTIVVASVLVGLVLV